MSKSKGNVLDPFETISDFGADPVRWYLLSTSNLWTPTKFDSESLKEVIRKYFDTLRNTYSFFALYANIDDIPARAHETGMSIEAYLENKAGEEDRFDRWIVSRFNSLVSEVSAGLDKYEITSPVRAIQAFVIDELSNWYVRNNRRRFWAEGDDPSKMRAYLTLYRMLVGICRLTAPMTPMVSEMIWRQLVGADHNDNSQTLSVHLTDYPKADESVINTDLEECMGLVEKIVSLGRAARARRNIKVRQPLSQLMVTTPKGLSFERLTEYLGIIKDELNIKTIESADNLDQYISYTAKLNFKQAGPRLGGRVKTVGPIVARLDSERVRQLDLKGELEIEIDGGTITLTREEIDISRTEKEGYAIENDGEVTIALATELSEELIAEGFARELVSKIQNMRKSSGFEVIDHINVLVGSTDRLKTAVENWEEFIRRETLANRISFADGETVDNGTEWNINGERTIIAVSKA